MKDEEIFEYDVELPETNNLIEKTKILASFIPLLSVDVNTTGLLNKEDIIVNCRQEFENDILNPNFKEVKKWQPSSNEKFMQMFYNTREDSERMFDKFISKDAMLPIIDYINYCNLKVTQHTISDIKEFLKTIIPEDKISDIDLNDDKDITSTINDYLIEKFLVPLNIFTEEELTKISEKDNLKTLCNLNDANCNFLKLDGWMTDATFEELIKRELITFDQIQGVKNDYKVFAGIGYQQNMQSNHEEMIRKFLTVYIENFCKLKENRKKVIRILEYCNRPSNDAYLKDLLRIVNECIEEENDINNSIKSEWLINSLNNDSGLDSDF